MSLSENFIEIPYPYQDQSPDTNNCIDCEEQLNQTTNEVLEQEAALKTRPHVCFHCGNRSIMYYIGRTSQESQYDLRGYKLPGIPIDHENWYIFECPSCHRPIIISSRYSDIDDYPYTIQLRYPQLSIIENGIPNVIYDAYLAAIRTKGIDYHICLLSLRRVLEMICKDKGEITGTLENKIDRLIEKGTLSPVFSDACWIIRKLGNESAHGDNKERFEYEAEEIITYVSEIINYLYALPIQTKSMRNRVERERQSRGQRFH